MSDREDSNTDTNDDLKALKVIITIVVLIVAFFVSIVVAKLVDMCYDRRAIRDDASDISENTRNLIRARLSVIQFKKRDRRKPEVDGEKRIKHSAIMDFFRRWAQKVRDRRKTREISIKSTTPPSDDVVINVDKDETGTTSANCNNNPVSRTPRLPLFSGGKMPAQNSIFATRPISAKKPQPPSPFGASMSRNSAVSMDRSTLVSGKSINDKVRPVSSQPRHLPNVTRADVDNNTKVHVKSVHFDENPSDLSDNKTKPEVDKPKPEISKPQPDKVSLHDTKVSSIGDVDS